MLLDSVYMRGDVSKLGHEVQHGRNEPLLRCALHWTRAYNEPCFGKSGAEYAQLLEEVERFSGRLMAVLDRSPAAKPKTRTAAGSSNGHNGAGLPLAAAAQA